MFEKDIEEFLDYLTKKHEYNIYHHLWFTDRNVYIEGCDTSSSYVIGEITNYINKRRMIVNIVNPSLELTKVLILEHFTPYIEDNKIVWSFW